MAGFIFPYHLENYLKLKNIKNSKLEEQNLFAKDFIEKIFLAKIF